MSSGSNILKMLVGIVILVFGVVWYTGVAGYLGYWKELVDVLKATIGLLLLFVGLIVAWMGYDDYKMDAEMAKEEKKEPQDAKKE